MSDSRTELNASTVVIPHARWPLTPTLPTDEYLRVIFHGLLSFCYTADGFCQVGIFSSPDHKLIIRVLEGECPTGTVEPPEYKGEDLLEDGEFKLEVSTGLKGVTSYQRTDLIDPQDFRLVPDIEGPHFFNTSTPLPKRPGFYKQKLIIEKGVFYTADTTVSTFKRSEISGSPLQIGIIAYLVGVKISLPLGQFAVLRLKPKGGGPDITRSFRPEQGLREIHISNGCSKNGRPCMFSDFNHHFRSLEAPHNQRFLLEPHRPVKEITHPCEQGKLVADFTPLSTDPAPCAASGYGQSPGVP